MKETDTESTGLRDRILLATLAHVPFDGWTEAALEQGVADAGLGTDFALRAFPDGVPDLVGHFSDWADRRMMAQLEALDMDSLRVHGRVAAGVRSRLEALEPHREAVRRVLSFLALPHNAPMALRLTCVTVDAIWYAAGDRSADFNFYTKRGLLASVYGMTVLYWLNDDSENSADTWSFLDRRIADVLTLPRLRARLKNAFSHFALDPAGWRPPRRGRAGR